MREVAARAEPEPFLVLPVVVAPAGLRRAPGTLAVIVASFVVVGLGEVWPAVTRWLQATTVGLEDFELWRLLTYVFPHEHGWIHVLVNMAVLALFGWQLERLLETLRFLIVYLGSGAIGMALLFAFNPIDAAHGIRGGASLAVFGTVAALATSHAVRSGIRSPAMRWAAPTCLVLLTAAGLRHLNGKDDLIDPGLDGFLFGFLNHALGMVAGVLLGISVPRHGSRRARLMAGGVALVVFVAGLGVGRARWA